jgi:AraC-like DNA-binding protein
MEFTVVDPSMNTGMRVWVENKTELTERVNTTERYKLILIEEGSGFLEINDKKLIFTAPVVFCLSNEDKIKKINSLKTHASILYFHPTIINKLLTMENILSIRPEVCENAFQDLFVLYPFLTVTESYYKKLVIDPITAKRISGLFRSIENEFILFRAYWPCRSKSFLLQALFLISSVFQAEIIDRNFSEFSLPHKELDLSKVPEETASVILYLHNNYAAKITIEQLTNHFHINRTTLTKNFNEATGMTIITYLNTLRIRVACILLRDTLLPISEIIEQVGFTENSHFIRTFKKYTGTTPTEYRKENCWMLQVPQTSEVT